MHDTHLLLAAMSLGFSEYTIGVWEGGNGRCISMIMKASVIFDGDAFCSMLLDG
jgi:hypothetical protein